LSRGYGSRVIGVGKDTEPFQTLAREGCVRLAGRRSAEVATNSCPFWQLGRTAILDAYKNETGAALRDSKVRGVENSRDDGVVAPKREIPLDLAPNRAPLKLIHARHVLEQKGARAQVVEDLDKLPVQPVPWIVDQSVVIAHLAKRLARRAACKQIEPPASNRVNHRDMLMAVGQITLHQYSSGKVETQRRATVWIVVRRRD
jgi:hypothetical protein